MFENIGPSSGQHCVKLPTTCGTPLWRCLSFICIKGTSSQIETFNNHLLSNCNHVKSEEFANIVSQKLCKTPSFIHHFMGGGPRVVVSTAAFHSRVRDSLPSLGGLKKTKNVSSPSTCESQYCVETP